MSAVQTKDELFPTKFSAIIFVVYIGLFINQGLLVTATKSSKNEYSYNTTTVVMMTECLKLCIAACVFLKDHSFKQLFTDILQSKRVFLLYFTPAILYCFYNNLAFVNLSEFDPTTYFLLLQIRVVVTGVIFQVLFKRHLSSKQWISLLLLTFGCIVKQFHLSSQSSLLGNNFFNIHLVFILVQVFCSCFAGVYNEYLLKDGGLDTHLMIQNIFMYFDSIICNFVVLLMKNDVAQVFSKSSFASITTPLVLLIIVNNAGCGIVTSLFLKNFNSILKSFASALELLLTAVICWLLFGIAIDLSTALAILIVSYAIYLYSQNPVANQNTNTSQEKDNPV